MKTPVAIVRRPTRPVSVGPLTVGGDAPVSIQSMTNTVTADVEATMGQVRALAAAGCEIVRVAVPDENALEGFGSLRKNVRLPLVADIHFDHRLAVGAIEVGADAVRINLRSIELLEGMGFFALKVSAKASDPLETVHVYRILSEEVDYPLHLGVTEAGTPLTGSTRTAAALALLLSDGIGDTIRFSLSGDPIPEVHAGYELLRALDLRTGARVVACPTCARAEIDVAGWAREVEERVQNLSLSLRVAVMGCPVNGPGEAREADVGLAGGKGRAVLFVKGKVMKKVSPDEAVEALMEEIDRLIEAENQEPESRSRGRE
jgi:(E)-4-hydroxy-3-methylbut-2-enyl-diphosphate synthase